MTPNKNPDRNAQNIQKSAAPISIGAENVTEIIVKDIRLPIDADIGEAFDAAAKKLRLSDRELIGKSLHKRSLDARRRGGRDPEFVCSVTMLCAIDEKKREKISAIPGTEIVRREKLEFPTGSVKPDGRIVVVGFGPAGMFAALTLAEHGYRPLVIERGKDASSRAADVERFIKTGRLDADSNIQFGAGGAGTFSDGKLVTRINDPRCSYVLKRFHEFGAPDEILYFAKPHVGTDRLLGVVDGITKRIVSLGGEVRFGTKLTDLSLKNGRVDSILADTIDGSEKIKVGALIFAVGHSARDSFAMLSERGVSLLPKPFSVGIRVEHLQEDIDRALYGDFAERLDRRGKKLLPPGEYSLSHRERQSGLVSDTARGVYSFCMCPGGEVVAAASENGGVVTNGMSRYARDGKNANAAIAVSVFPEDIGGGWDAGIKFQRELEKAAFTAGGSDYSAPVETLGDFLHGKTTHFTEPGRVTPTYMDGKYRLADMSSILPGFVSDMLKKGFTDFGRKLRGFDMPEAVLTGVETRTSSPVRIPRNDLLTSAAADNLYPCGEGAGYAGGITSAAIDGINSAMKLMSVYKPE